MQIRKVMTVRSSLMRTGSTDRNISKIILKEIENGYDIVIGSRFVTE